jgi:precorrin-3B synthase
MTESRRRGACPCLSAPMPTGDGLLVRLITAAPVVPDAMAGLCEAARRHGNGTMEITARGSVQVRGLTPRSAPLFAAAVAELGIAAQEGVSVIAGFDDDVVDLLAAELRRAIADVRLALSPKVSVVVDGAGPLHLDGLSADVRLRAVASAQGLQSSAHRLYLGIASGERNERAAHAPPGANGNVAPTTWLGTVALEDAVGGVIDILGMIAAHGPAARAADVFGCEGVTALRAVARVDQAPAPPPRPSAEMIGLQPMRDGAAALGAGLAFGQTHADALAELVRVAARHGAQAVRPAPERTLLLTGVSVRDANDLAAAAEQLGFVAHSHDPRRRIAACPGAPACASGLIPSRTLASTLAPALAPIFGAERNGVSVHISGCPKGCAHPAQAALTLVGTLQGCGVVYDGAARATPHCYVDPARLGDEIARLVATPTEAAHG